MNQRKVGRKENIRHSLRCIPFEYALFLTCFADNISTTKVMSRCGNNVQMIINSKALRIVQDMDVAYFNTDAIPSVDKINTSVDYLVGYFLKSNNLLTLFSSRTRRSIIWLISTIVSKGPAVSIFMVNLCSEERAAGSSGSFAPSCQNSVCRIRGDSNLKVIALRKSDLKDRSNYLGLMSMKMERK
jgi:hypothetical protein